MESAHPILAYKTFIKGFYIIDCNRYIFSIMYISSKSLYSIV